MWDNIALVDYRGIKDRGTTDRGSGPTKAVDASGSPAEGNAAQSTTNAGWFDAYEKEYTGEAITREDWDAAAKELGCEVAAIKAIAEVESGMLGAFWKPGWPIILFERHLFSAATNRQFDKAHPEVSNRVPYHWPSKQERKKGVITDEMYAWTQDENWSRMEKAYALDNAAAFASASWGKFQVLGQNHVEAGFLTVEDYVRSMCASEREQMIAFASFVKNNAKLVNALKKKNWKDVASIYNGTEYWRFQYDERMEAAYKKEAAVK